MVLPVECFESLAVGLPVLHRQEGPHGHIPSSSPQQSTQDPPMHIEILRSVDSTTVVKIGRLPYGSQ